MKILVASIYVLVYKQEACLIVKMIGREIVYDDKEQIDLTFKMNIITFIAELFIQKYTDNEFHDFAIQRFHL